MTPFGRVARSVRETTGGLPRTYWVLWAGMFVNRIGSFVLPFLALYLTQELGLTPGRAGLVIGLYGAGASVAGPLGGFLADRIGRRVVLVTALVAGGAGTMALAFVHRLDVLAPVLFLVAMVGEMYRPAMQATIADVVPPADRVRAYGLTYWVINVGYAIGLTLGGLLASRSFAWLFLGDGATTLVFGVLVFALVGETRPATPPRAAGASRPHPLAGFFAPYRDGHFVMFIALSFLYALVFMQNATTFAVDLTAHGLSKSVFGRVLALNGLLIVIAQPFVGPVLARRNRSRTLAVGAGITGLGFGLNAVSRTIPLYALGVAVWTLGEMMVLPVANALVADLAPAAVRGRYQGAYGLSFSLAVCVAPALGLAALEHWGSVALWTGCLATGLAVAAGHLALAPALTATRRERLAGGGPPSR